MHFRAPPPMHVALYMHLTSESMRAPTSTRTSLLPLPTGAAAVLSGLHQPS